MVRHRSGSSSCMRWSKAMARWLAATSSRASSSSGNSLPSYMRYMALAFRRSVSDSSLLSRPMRSWKVWMRRVNRLCKG